MIPQARLLDRIIDPEFDLADAKEAVGDVMFDGITCDEPNDCDHKAQIADDGSIQCAFCGRPLGR